MFKRFTDCQKWQDPWYRKLPAQYKLLWQYICDSCDNAGVWKADLETASHFIGAEVLAEESLKHLSGRVQVLGSGYWLVTKFISFQFGDLSESSPLHKSVLKLVQKYTLALPYPYPSTRVQVKVSSKDVVVKDVKKGGVGENKSRPKDPREVSEYAKGLGFDLDGQYFFDYQEARGWALKTGPIKDWRAVVRTWKKNGYLTGGKANAPNGGESVVSWTARQRAKIEAEKSRTGTSGGAVFNGDGGLPELPAEAGAYTRRRDGANTEPIL